MRQIIRRADGYRLCWYCKRNWIGQCMGAVKAGDWLLSVAGKIPVTAIRERCGSCQAVHIRRREMCGPYVQFAALLADQCRRVAFHLEMRFRPVRYETWLGGPT